MSNASSVALVNNLKESLVKTIEGEGQDEERVLDILKRLNDCPMTLDILSETMVGKAVSQCKKQFAESSAGTQAKTLIKKWKELAKQGESNGITNSATTTQSQSVKAKKTAVKRQSSTSSSTANAAAIAAASQEWSGLPTLRQNLCTKFYEVLSAARSALIKEGVHASAIDQLMAPRAAEVEAALCEKYGQEKSEYTGKARSLAFNLKKNIPLCQQVLLGQVPADALVTMTSDQLASQEIIQARIEEAKKLNDAKRLDWDQANEAKINEMCGIKGDLLQASLFTCGRCKSVKTTSTQKQTRSADEPMTVFVLCLNCGNRWKC